MASFDPENWVIFVAGLLLGCGFAYITASFTNLHLRIQDLKIKTKRLTNEKALEESIHEYKWAKGIFIVLFLW